MLGERALAFPSLIGLIVANANPTKMKIIGKKISIIKVRGSLI